MWLIAWLLLAASSTGPVTRPTGLGKPEIREVFRRSMARFIQCFEVQVSKGVDISARVDITFTIIPNGSVRDSNARGINHELEACVVGVVRTLVFPRSRTSTRVHYPLRVHPAGN